MKDTKNIKDTKDLMDLLYGGGWQIVGTVPEEHGNEFIEALGEMFPNKTVGLLFHTQSGKKVGNPVDLRVKPELSPLQFSAWLSNYRRLARKHGWEDHG
jgi:hypothetical protein